jgi:hypothetical protein
MSYVAIDSQLGPGQASADLPKTSYRINQAIYDAKRLASFRLALGTMLIGLGAPVLILGRSTDPRIRSTLAILSILWLMLLLPMVRLLFVESRNRRLLTNLRALTTAHKRFERAARPIRSERNATSARQR